jgi:hypothetical protein
MSAGLDALTKVTTIAVARGGDEGPVDGGGDNPGICPRMQQAWTCPVSLTGSFGPWPPASCEWCRLIFPADGASGIWCPAPKDIRAMWMTRDMAEAKAATP